ncbi:unnamed protein product [Fructobacillus fructosus]|uniref:hypothetical protein n=1 Tax=Fructobacillus fructosus TaxID=1631 RepID=UPI002D831298|nr:unnamed protein product [Fructobacillus fructosus]
MENTQSEYLNHFINRIRKHLPSYVHDFEGLNHFKLGTLDSIDYFFKISLNQNIVWFRRFFPEFDSEPIENQIDEFLMLIQLFGEFNSMCSQEQNFKDLL